VAVAALAAAGAQDAPASTTLGSTFSPNTGCTSGDTFIQEATPAGAPSYAAPFSGVISSWSYQATANALMTMKLKVARAAGGTNYTTVGESTTQTPAANTTNTYPTRIAVQAGDVIGFYQTNGGQPNICGMGGLTAADQYGITGGDPAPGTTASYLTNITVRYDVSAQLERDADGDGYGDETQDVCFTDPSTQGACPAPTIAGTAQIGQTLTGTPSGAPVSPSYQWLDCDEGGASCAPIAGATATSYVVASSDAGHTLRFRKTASDASGAQTTDSAQTAVVLSPPGTGPGPRPIPVPTPAPPPSCGFSLLGATASSADGGIVVTLRLPGAGALDVLGTEDKPRAWVARLQPGRNRFAYGRLDRRVRGAGRVRIRLSPNKQGRRLLRRHRGRGWALHIRVWAAYTPRGGHACAKARKVRVLRPR